MATSSTYGSTIIEEIEPVDETVENHLKQVLSKSDDDPEKLLATVFDFLARKTSFWNGSAANAKVTALLRRYAAAVEGVKPGFLGAAPSKVMFLHCMHLYHDVCGVV
jgi:hypothetical protein